MEYEGTATAVWNHESDWQMLRFSFWLALALLMLHDSYIQCFPHLNCVAKTRMRCTPPELETLPPTNAMLASFCLKVETKWNIHWSTPTTNWGGFDCKNSSCAGRLSRAVPEKNLEWMHGHLFVWYWTFGIVLNKSPARNNAYYLWFWAF